MSAKNTKQAKSDSAESSSSPPAADGTPAAGIGAASGEPQPASAVTAAEEELAALRSQIEELKAKNLRQLADAQNAAKRAEREKQEAIRYAEAAFAKELLGVVDDLERTLESARHAKDSQKVADGVRIIYEQFLKVLKAHHIVPIEAEGKPFDPSFHEALLQQPSNEHPPGTVMQELARGYTMHERVLRPTRAIISAGPETGQEPTE